MNIALWAVQVLLALAFLTAGLMKAFQPLDKVANSLGWVKDVPASLVRFIGVAELLGAIGLVLFALVVWRSGPARILADLARLSALQIAVLMALRAVY